MKTGTYHLRLYVENTDWPENKLPGHMGPEIPADAKPVCHELELFEENGVPRGIHTMPNGKQKILSVTASEYTAAWEAFAGAHGDEPFQFVITASDSSDAVWGFAAGRDRFQGFIAVEGEFVQP